MKTLVEIHVLQNFAPSNLNRDDTGAPKDAWFGGTRRARVSSQCSKRAVREYFKSAGLLSEAEMGVRTKRLMLDLTTRLQALGRSGSDVEAKVRSAIAATGLKLKGEKTEYLLFLADAELEKLAEEINERWDDIGDASAQVRNLQNAIADRLGNSWAKKQLDFVYCLLKLDGPAEKVKPESVAAVENCFDELIQLLGAHAEDVPQLEGSKLPKRTKDAIPGWELEVNELLKAEKGERSLLGKSLLTVLDGKRAVDLGLFGRMLANMPEKNQHAACQVAHAISTHAVEREFDFYTAVDDLKPEDTAGADMMGTVEFNSACFYRYAAVDWEKLKENLQGDPDLPAKGLRAFLEGFVVAEPTGKQNSFAAHNAPEFVLVTVSRKTAPRNLANAFESAVRVREDLTKVSAERLLAKAVALQKAYGGGSETWALSLVDVKLGGYAQRTDTLDALLDAVMASVGRD